jgi:tetratricopeptide (TPR) repeat protein
MTLYEYYYRVINWPTPRGLTIAFAIGFALLIVAAVILALGRLRRFARAVGVVGMVIIVVVMAIVPLQTIPMGWIDGRRLTRPRFTYLTRVWSTMGLVIIPSVGIAIMLKVLLSTQRRLRALAPRLLKAGRNQLIRQNYAAALHEYNRAIDISPLLGEAYCQRGLVHLAMGSTDPALADFERAIELDPRLAVAYIQRAKVRMEKGQYDLAHDDYRQVLILRNNDPECYLNRGICFLAQGRSNEAAADFQRVLKLTNHSDYAEPAKTHLHAIETRNRVLAPVQGKNGASDRGGIPLPKTEDLRS